MLRIIVAIDKNRGIGKDNKLLVKLKKDMKYFQEVTSGNTVVMGRKTYESIGRALPNRKNIVITHGKIDNRDVISMTLEEFKELYIKENKEDVYIIGGASIYKELIGYVDELLVTEIEGEFESDSFFPLYKGEFKEYSRKEEKENGIAFSFVVYKRDGL